MHQVEYCSETDEFEEDEYSDVESLSIEVEEVNAVNNSNVFCEMLIGDKPVTFQIDSGATTNIIPEIYVNDLTEINNCSKTLKMYNGATERTIGECKIQLRNPATKKKYTAPFVVIGDDQ